MSMPMELLESRVFFAVDFAAAFTPDVLPALAGPGQAFTVPFEFRNRGGTAVAQTLFRTILSTDRTIGNADDITINDHGTSKFRMLKGYTSQEQAGTDALPDTLVAGQSYYIAVQLDQSSIYAENNETNNLIVSEQPLLRASDVNDSIVGTPGSNRIIFSAFSASEMRVSFNGVMYRSFYAPKIDAGDGNDYVQIDAGVNLTAYRTAGSVLSGGAGNDTLVGADFNDALYGGGGKDLLLGNDGDDYLSGDFGNDRLAGGAGSDKLYGGSGNDQLHGGAGADIIWGQSGNDVLYARDNEIDNVNGGAAGDDLAQTDRTDIVSSLERRLPNEPVY